MQKPIDLVVARHMLFIALLLASSGAALTGCNPTEEKTDQVADAATPEVQVSSVPLRVWVIGQVSDQSMFTRQWLSNSDQPLTIQTFSEQDFLQLESCDCDIAIYPARLIGELAARNWIVKVPELLASSGSALSEDEVSSVPAAWLNQARYDRIEMAVPMGCSIPVFVASDALAAAVVSDSNPRVAWSELLSALGLSEAFESASPVAVDLTAVDREALVDRYFAIVASVSQRDPAYGFLFDLQSMKTRLGEPEFVLAAKILAALAAQPDGDQSLLYSHSQAWTWAAKHGGKALSVAAPVMLSAEAAALKSGGIIRPFDTAISAEQNRPSGMVQLERPKISAWNVGSGMLVSLAAKCRQTNPSAAFLRWCRQADTRTILADLIPGIEAPSPRAGTETLSWRSRQQISEFTSGPTIAMEPRLPAAAEYRASLAENLLKFLTGTQTAEAALGETSKAWLAITSDHKEQRLEYEKSLGLNL